MNGGAERSDHLHPRGVVLVLVLVLIAVVTASIVTRPTVPTAPIMTTPMYLNIQLAHETHHHLEHRPQSRGPPLPGSRVEGTPPLCGPRLRA